jgi:nicotinate-nucleotide pyrophosphorylase (carboxylating)
MPQEVSALITLALREDLGTTPSRTLDILGDITSLAFIPADSISMATLVARESLTLSGLEVATECFLRIDPTLTIRPHASEGDAIQAGQTLLSINGSTHSILSAERTALNFLGRLCGIATLTRRYADAVTGTKVHLLDTRKTTPGWRLLEKQAVKAGGCVNHRMGLFDAVLVKDNHLAALGDLSLLPPVLGRISKEHPGLVIEIEADTLVQVEQLLNMPEIDVILLDNMSCELMGQAVALRDKIAPNILLEASGGVTLERLPEIARTGVDRISVGALTHSALNADLSLEIDPR